jgi:hypothetical protein
MCLCQLISARDGGAADNARAATADVLTAATTSDKRGGLYGAGLRSA